MPRKVRYASFMKASTICVHTPLQKKYCYELSEPEGKNFDPLFEPDLTPKQMLALGVFSGNYFEGEIGEYPKEWFQKAKISPKGDDHPLNFFGVKASQSRAEWQRKGWMYKDDPRGWFEWYSRYYLGRRIPEEDMRQIKRWRAIRRHISQLSKNCNPGDFSCRPVQRQALLHWAYDSRKM